LTKHTILYGLKAARCHSGPDRPGPASRPNPSAFGSPRYWDTAGACTRTVTTCGHGQRLRHGEVAGAPRAAENWSQWRGNKLQPKIYLLLHDELEGEPGRGVLTREAFGVAATNGVEDGEQHEVEGKALGSVLLLQKEDIRRGFGHLAGDKMHDGEHSPMTGT
jgi:hypothetical protein